MEWGLTIHRILHQSLVQICFSRRGHARFEWVLHDSPGYWMASLCSYLFWRTHTCSMLDLQLLRRRAVAEQWHYKVLLLPSHLLRWLFRHGMRRLYLATNWMSCHSWSFQGGSLHLTSQLRSQGLLAGVRWVHCVQPATSGLSSSPARSMLGHGGYFPLCPWSERRQLRSICSNLVLLEKY